MKPNTTTVLHHILLLLVLIVLSGCGGGGSSTGKVSSSVALAVDPVKTLIGEKIQTITGTVKNGATVIVENDANGTKGKAMVNGNTWSYTVTGLVEGVNNLTITATTTSGDSTMERVVITVDTTAPQLTVNPITTPTKSVDQIIGGTTEAGATVYVQIDASSVGGYATVSGSNWSYALTRLAVGPNTITVTAKDAAGNTSVASSTIELMTSLIAHRGSSFIAPENTLSAFNLAWQQGADGVELDVYLSKDNRIVVLHDPTTKRTAGTDLVVKDTTSAVLRTLDVGKFKGSQYAGERIPFLEEAIATIPPGRKLHVEIKVGIEILPFLQEVINNSGKKDQIVVLSFDLASVSEFKKMMPEIPCIYLVRSYESNQQLIQKAVNNDLDGLNVEYPYVTPSLVTDARKSNLQLFSWTADEYNVTKKLKEYGVNGIITDMPDAMMGALN